MIHGWDQTELDEACPCWGLKMLRLERFLERMDSKKEGLVGVEGNSLSRVVTVREALLPEVYVSPEDKLGRGGV